MSQGSNPYAGGKTWRFVQLGGMKKELLLAGLDAPFGRPRQRPVVRDAVEVREQTIYYAGSNLPTRHIYGVRYEPWELRGRIGDRNPVSSNPTQMPPGTGYAKAFVDYIKKFVADQQPVQVQWGDILSAKAFIKKFEPGREAEYEVEYMMTVLIDSDETSPTTVSALNSRRSTQDATQQAIDALNALPQMLPASSSIRPSLLDSIDNLITAFTSATGNLVNAASAISNIDKAAVSDLQRLRASIGQVRTASLELQDTIDSVPYQLATIRSSWQTDMDFGGARAVSDLALIRALAGLETVNTQAEIAERGAGNTSYVAKANDTWELIAMNQLGSPDQADAIRLANGIRYGQVPEGGRAYKIPQA